jgi:hypothetical protein
MATVGWHVILFEHANFHGRHKHVFKEEPNLNAPDDNSFNDITSSIVVLKGRWEFFIDSDFQGRTGDILSVGLYPWVAQKPHPNIQNDAISSLNSV